MRFKSLIRLGLVTLIAGTLAGCGSDGSNGSAGAPGATGATGATGPAGQNAVATVAVAGNSTTPTSASTAAWAALAPQVTVQSVTIASAPVVKFTVKDAAGNPVVGLGNTSKSSTAIVAGLTNIGFTLAKLVPGTNGAPSKWVSYLVTKPVTVAQAAGTIGAADSCNKTATAAATWCGTFPTTDAQGTLVDNKDGTYQYTFYRDVKAVKDIVAGLTDSTDGLAKKADLGDLTFDATLTHRLGIQIGGAAPGTGSNTPNAVTVTPSVNMVNTANAVFDFRPDGGSLTSTRNVVKIDSCSGCHDGKVLAHGSRKDPQYCVTCHTDQIRYTFSQEASASADGMTLTGTTRPTTAVVNGRALGNFPNMVHHIHMGEELLKQGYFFNASSEGKFNEVRYPQDARNCTKCHNGSATAVNQTANGDNWKMVPSRLACGACHDGINFATGGGTTLNGAFAGHVGGAKADDSQCALCHGATDITVYHQTTIASPNNTVKAGVASFTYKLSGVTINASKQLVVKFQILKDGTPVALNAYAAGAVPITGYTGGPSFYVTYATGQDGIAAPTDWNSGHSAAKLTDIWAGSFGNTLSAPDATNTYTATLAAASATVPLAVPADAKMVTASLAGAFTDPTFGSLPGVPAMMAASGNTPDGKANVARRVIFSESKCNSCHDRLGTSPNFHGGNYSIAMCAICHIPNQGGSTGWSASFRVWVHGIHGASKRTVPFTWHAVSATENYSQVGYPGVLKDCQQCHLPGTYDFSASQYTPALIAGMLNVQANTGIKNPAATNAYVFPQVGGQWAYGIKVDNVTDYGTGWSINATTGMLNAKTTQDSNLVSSPITAACSACHDSSTATAHMEGNGGSFYDKRIDAVARTEQCLLCHGAGKVADIKLMHEQ